MEVPRYWRLKDQRYSLIGDHCPHCDTKHFPPREICPDCGGEIKMMSGFTGQGTIYSYSEISTQTTNQELQKIAQAV